MTTTEGKYLDLDAALDEEIPLVVRLGGRDWELPGSPPAAVLVRVSRWLTDGLMVEDDDGNPTPAEGTTLTEAHYVQLIGDMLPRHILEEWSALGLVSADRLPKLVESLMAKYQEHSDALAGLGGGDGPKAGTRAQRRSTKSSNGGGSSKRTSTGTTASRTSSRS